MHSKPTIAVVIPVFNEAPVLPELFRQLEDGFTPLVTLVLFRGGVQLIEIGIVGEYLGRIYEVKRRPHYIVKNRIGFD